MKAFKVIGLDIYIVNVEDIKQAVGVCLANRIGITEKNLVEIEKDLLLGLVPPQTKELISDLEGKKEKMFINAMKNPLEVSFLS